MKLLKALTGSAVVAGLLLSAGGCELIVAPDRTKIGEGGGGTGGQGGGGQGGGGQGGTVCTPVDDNNDCTEDVCENDQPVNNPLAAGETCSAGVCDGAGVCVPCLEDDDCNAPQVCITQMCVDPTCMDEKLDGDETDVDCGGSCPKCADDLNCEVADDCQSGVCTGMKCQTATCDDTVQNGDETDVDCGGSCAPAKKCADGDGCGIGDDCVSGVCDGTTCQVPECGDGVQNQPTESCDDGNMVDGDGCDNNCTMTGCGNGTIAGNEVCDDGNQTNGDGCDDGPGGNCTATACGNGVLTGTEVCDDGNKTNGDNCDDGMGGNCTPTACGNGVLTGTEVCDDGNQTNGDNCDDAAGANCTPTACGNGVLTAGETCDDGNNTLGDGCDDGPNGNCTATDCGNGVVSMGEACDDGNNTNGDNCDDGPMGNCTATACGNGVLTGTEVCDTGNGANGDGCDDGPGGNCTPSDCGNGVVAGGEACDDGNNTNGDACDDGPMGNCTIAGCGNGVIVAPEVCDDNNTTSGDGCDANCTPTGCGNGIVTGTEQCDDGNLVNGDGCDSAAGSGCKTTACGNGVLTGTEACDDGNTTAGDGCSATCTTENLESEPNNACGAQDGPFTVNPTANVIGAITPVADEDFYTFTLPGPGVSSIKIETFTGFVTGACLGGADTFVELRGTNCTTVLASDDDDGLNFCSLIDAAAAVGPDLGARKLPAGTYTVKVNELGNNATIASYNVQVTVLSVCGNGMMQPTEACDDGNLTNNDGCDANCTVTACGNGVQAGTETCDDGNTANGDGCSATCTVEAGYTCTGTFPSVCLGICGDGVLQINEGCDDANTANGDCCSSTCALQACEAEMNGACGSQNPMPAFAANPKASYASGAITPVADVDFYSFVLTKPSSVKIETFGPTPAGCPGDTFIELRNTNCTSIIATDDDDYPVGTCSLIDPATDSAARNLPPGTYSVRVNEFGNDLTIASYGLRVTLVDECGNGVKGAFETGCDDGNNNNGDGCNATCGVETGYTCTGTAPSVCTDNNECLTNPCSANATCTNTPGSFTCMCNAGFTGTGVGVNGCTSVCGDGLKVGTEACDDNNTMAGDGCNATCTAVEAGYTCVGQGAGSCTDNNECTAGTPCDTNATCTNTPGSFTCMCNFGFAGTGVGPNSCTATCGDGLKASTEGCDDMNTMAGDGCSATCTVESGYSCTGTMPSVCTDINECMLNTDNCDANATCTNTVGGFTCECNGEYIGNGVICSLTESCEELHIAKPALASGDYMIDSDGTGGNAAFTVRCDMTTDGGGWTLVFNDGTGFDETLTGSGAETGYTTNFISLAYSTVTISSDVMIDASDSAIVAENQETRTIITASGGTGQTVRAIFQGGASVFFDNDTNTNVATTGLTCGSFGKWADYEAAVCTATKVLVGNDQTGSFNFAFGIDNSSSSTDNNSAGWPQDPNFGGTNFFPDNFRVWVR